MKIVLLKDVKGIGKKLDVKEVPDGYARNFLIPRNLAAPATKENIQNAEKIKLFKQKENQEQEKSLRRISTEISEKRIKFFLKADDHGKLFGSVNKDSILKALRENKFITKEHVEIKIDHPIKELGDYEVEMSFGKGIKTKLKITIERSPK